MKKDQGIEEIRSIRHKISEQFGHNTSYAIRVNNSLKSFYR